MNAVTLTQPHDHQPADPAQNLILVPLSRLRLSKRKNVRKTAGLSIEALAASIDRVGLLQNLIVVAAADGVHYDVVAGGRRLMAQKLRVKKRRIPPDVEVPCLLVADASARTVSLTENLQREAMHPADQFEAFAALVAEGRPIEDIAADFGVTPLVVQRRLRLANVSPRLIADYRAGAVTLEQLMALAICDDHAAQEAAFYDAPAWQRDAAALRERLTEREIEAGHPLARFVGLDAYTAAGGGLRRDLFAEDDSMAWLTDAALLERLVREKLDGLAEPVRAEGWAWVEAVPHLSYADRQAFQSAPRQRREPTAREARRLQALQGRIYRTDEALEVAYEAEDESKAESLSERRDAMVAALETLQAGLLTHAPEVRAVAGAIITIDRDGEMLVHRGLLREAEAKALRTLERLRNGLADEEGAGDGGERPAVPTSGNLSDRLAQRLSAHRTAALQVEVARRPQVGLAAVVHGMVQTVLQQTGCGRALPVGVCLTVQDRLDKLAPDWPESPAATALRELQQAWGERLPEDPAALFAALLAMSQEELVRLLAVCVASTVDVITPRATQAAPGAVLAQAVGLDMARWWRPTADSYFRHVSKAAMLEAVGQLAPQHLTRLAKLKKGELAAEAERLVEGTGWMPAVFAGEAAAVVETDETAGATETEDVAGAGDALHNEGQAVAA